MSAHDKEKRALERVAVELFLPLYNDLYNDLFKKEFRLLNMQERPDAVLGSQDAKRFGLEIAHLYYDDLEAQMLFGRSTSTVHGLQNFTYLLDRLNELIKQKQEKVLKYSCSYPVSLLIRSASPIFSGPDFENACDRIQVPIGLFQEVWLLAGDDQIPGWPHLICLGSTSLGNVGDSDKVQHKEKNC